MPTNRKILSAAAFSLALAGGGVAGAFIGSPTSSGAQDDPTETSVDAERTMGHPGSPGEGLATAAEAIGISEADLRSALEDGQSIAEVAATNDVEVQTVIDALVAAATDHLEAAIAELPDRITDLVNREGLPTGPRHGEGGPFGGGHRGQRPGLDAAAQAIGVTVEDLSAALRGGATVAEVAADNDVEVQTVIDALVAEATARADEAVAAGQITEAEAAERAADMSERITAMVKGAFRDGPGHDGPRATAAD